MITLDAFLVFLFAASLPVCYLLIMRHFIEGGEPKAPKAKRVDHSKYVSSASASFATSH